MRIFAAFLLPVAFLLTGYAAEPSTEPDDDNDAKKIIGTWEVVKAIKEGMPAPKNEIDGMKMEVSKDTMTIMTGGKGARNETVKYKLDMKSKPRGLDLVHDRGGKGALETIKGIYKIEKDQLTICFSKEQGNRPKVFDEKGRSILVLRKQKAK